MVHLFEDISPYKYKISRDVITSPSHADPFSPHSLVRAGGFGGGGGGGNGQRSVLADKQPNWQYYGKCAMIGHIFRIMKLENKSARKFR
jgi:hypothetical protein